jgi:hypothetical protein
VHLRRCIDDGANICETNDQISFSLMPKNAIERPDILHSLSSIGADENTQKKALNFQFLDATRD